MTAQTLYHLGRWVYLVDAADDLRANIKSGGYNPLALRFLRRRTALTPADSEVLALTLDGSVRAMAAAFELLPETKYTPVLRLRCTKDRHAVERPCCTVRSVSDRDEKNLYERRTRTMRDPYQVLGAAPPQTKR